MSRILHENVRQSDLLARIGGEEFALVMPVAGETAAIAAAEKLCGLVSATAMPPLQEPCTLSAGAASSMTTPLETLSEAADRALYRAKNTGRNRVCAPSLPE